MIKKTIILIFMLLFLQANAYAGGEYALGELLIKFKSGVSPNVVNQTLSANNLFIHSAVNDLDVYRVLIDSELTVPEILELLKDHPDVVYAEPNYIRYASKTANDLHANQWGLKNTGQTISCGSACVGSTSGSAGSDIDAETGWDTTSGSSSVIIAVFDTGADLDHPDLINNIVSGYDYVNSDSDPDDDHGHGTHVAGIAAAEGNNGLGVTGVCWNCKIMPIKVLDSAGGGLDSNIASGVTFAVANGANVLNFSLGGASSSQTLDDALKVAYDGGVVSVCAAGNENSSISYPAANDKYCIAVGATDINDNRASFSNTGPEMDVAAPGVDIYSTYIVGGADMSTSCKEDGSNSGYGFCTGTSMSTPIVSGLAGLIISQNPTYTVDQVLFRLIQTAQDVNSSSNSGFDNDIGVGRVKSSPSIITATNISIDEDTGVCFISSFK